MKANELMVGDWVSLTKTEDIAPCVVTALHPEDLFVLQPEWSAGEVVSYDTIYPIPLTAEILEKNGMYTEKTKMYAEGDIETYHDIDFVIPFPKEGHAHVWRNPHGYDFFHIEVMTVPWGRVDRTFRYVHELQQALRLCGLIKEANNFKV